MTRALVTGAAGFIGSTFCRAAVARGWTVVGLDNMSGYYNPAFKEARVASLPTGAVRFVRMDVQETDRLTALVREMGPDVVVHLAAQAGVRRSLVEPEIYVGANVAGMLGVLEACRHGDVPHLVYASSSSVYGERRDGAFRPTDRTDEPVSLYAATKKSGELMAWTYSHLFGLPVTTLRLFTVYGPWGRPDMAYFGFAEAIRKGEPVRLFNEGNVKRDFTFVDDVVDGIVRACTLPPTKGNEAPGEGAPYRLLNIGYGRPEPVSNMVDLLEKALGKSVNRILVPAQLGDVTETFADISETRRILGFEPTVSLAEGIPRFASWYLDHHAWWSG
jgi:UDP-glucuronate 4-epimerase